MADDGGGGDAARECMICCGDLAADEGPACPYCHRTSVCKTCWRTWLEGHPDNPVCPVTDTNAQGARACNRTLTSTFIREAMGQRWYEGVWAGIRSDQLFLLEQTHLPPLQPLAAKYKELIDKRKALFGGGAEDDDVGAGGGNPVDHQEGGDSSDGDDGNDGGKPKKRRPRGPAKARRTNLTPAEQRMRERSRAKITAAVARVKDCMRRVKEAKTALEQARKEEQEVRAADQLILAPPSLLCDKAMEALPPEQYHRLPSLTLARGILVGSPRARALIANAGARLGNARPVANLANANAANTQEQQDGPAPPALINCPRDGCRGYLHAPTASATAVESGSDDEEGAKGPSTSTSKPKPKPKCTPLRCELCKAVVCSRCQALVNGADADEEKPTTAGDEDDGNIDGLLHGHVCDKQVLASLAAIRRDSKPCPWPDCGAPTHRVSGCDQMWCVKCRRPWDWRSGRALHNPQYLHNPHYAEHVARQRAARRQGDDAPGSDDELDPPRARARGVRQQEAACMTNGEVYAYLRQHAREWANRLQSLTEMREYVARHGCFTETMKPDVSEAGALRDRVRYLAGELDEAAYKRSLYLRDRRCHALGATSDIVISTTFAAYDIARAWIQEHQAQAAATGQGNNAANATVDALGRDLTQLFERVNGDLRNNARLHGTGDYQLDPATWRLQSAKPASVRLRPGTSSAGPSSAKRPRDDDDDADDDAAAASPKRARPQTPLPVYEDNAGEDDGPIVISSDSDDELL